MSDKELVEHLSKTRPDIKEEVKFIANCPERIGIEPLRDILITQTKSPKQVTPYNSSSSCWHYIEMFKDMKNIMHESGKLMMEVSGSLSETLKSENKESGKTLS